MITFKSISTGDDVKFNSVKELFLDAKGNSVERKVRIDLFGEYLYANEVTPTVVQVAAKKLIEKHQRRIKNLETLIVACDEEIAAKKAKELQARVDTVAQAMGTLSEEQLAQLEEALNAAKQARAKTE